MRRIGGAVRAAPPGNGCIRLIRTHVDRSIDRRSPQELRVAAARWRRSIVHQTRVRSDLRHARAADRGHDCADYDARRGLRDTLVREWLRARRICSGKAAAMPVDPLERHATTARRDRTSSMASNNQAPHVRDSEGCRCRIDR